ncbi:transposase [Corynebacterium striatum]|uniref:transposase n=1 Tax=Corynebacterium striatum TaxID=43770 RepID=UPI003EC61BC6
MEADPATGNNNDQGKCLGTKLGALQCEYLQLRANALGRKDAAAACGIHPRDAADIDKGLIKLKGVRTPFVPDGPDVALYNRLMQVIPYVDGRESVPVQVIPQERIDQRISPRYLSVEEREIIFDTKRQGAGVREIARHLGRSPGMISKELSRNRNDFELYLPLHAQRKSVLRRFRPKKRKFDTNPKLHETVWEMLKDKCSPEQISGRLCRDYPGDESAKSSDTAPTPVAKKPFSPPRAAKPQPQRSPPWYCWHLLALRWLRGVSEAS